MDSGTNEVASQEIGNARSGMNDRKCLTPSTLQHTNPAQRERDNERRLDLMDLSTDQKSHCRELGKSLKSRTSELNARTANHLVHKANGDSKGDASQDWEDASRSPIMENTTYPHEDAVYALRNIEVDDDTACMEIADAELFQAAVIEHATVLGIDPEVEYDLLWVAKESLIAPLPEGWHAVTSTDSGEPYYYSEITGESRWDHPCDEQFRQLYLDLKDRKRLDATASHEGSPEQLYNSEQDHRYDTDLQVDSARKFRQHNDSTCELSTYSSFASIKRNQKSLGWFTDQISKDEQNTLEEVEEQNAALRNTLVRHSRRIMEFNLADESILSGSGRLESELKSMRHGNIATGRADLTDSNDPYPTAHSNDLDIVHSKHIAAEIDCLKGALIMQENAQEGRLRKAEDERKSLIEAHSKTTEKILNDQKLQEQSVQAHTSELIEQIKLLQTKIKHMEFEKRDLEEIRAQDEAASKTLRLSLEEREKVSRLAHNTLQSEVGEMRSIIQTQKADLIAANNQITSLLQQREKHDLLIRQAYDSGFEEAKRTSSALVEEFKIEKQRAADLYTQELRNRRKLHNRLMELQGNIRVFCRVRPISAIEVKSEEVALAVAFRDQDPQALELHIGSGTSNDGSTDANTSVSPGYVQKHVFEFDHVFQPNSSQADVFEQTRDLIVSALDGFNVCIFAYGQTGSGKTYTMEGCEDNQGVNFRALQELFRIRGERLATGNVDCSIKLSILEVYNETIIDLLGTGLDTGRRGLDIRVGKQGIHVENLKEVEVFGEADILASMKLGHSHRSVGSHDINEHSSRSHLVLSIKIETVLKSENRRLHSTLHLIDLAGSERVSKTAASGQRLKEAQNINRSLSALGDVISALGSNSKHVPYRNSKLTFLLQDSLSGNSKVLMFVNVSPVQWNAWESLCSLNFASRCRSIALGHAKANNTPTCAVGGSLGAHSVNSGNPHTSFRL
ncbi:hypothetical protein ABG067_000179 [Albugo candida]